MLEPIVLHASNPAEVDNGQKLETPVRPVLATDDTDLLVIYTGTAILNWPSLQESPDDLRTVTIVLQDHFLSRYGEPAGGRQVGIFLSIASEFSLGPGFTANYEWDFEIHNARYNIDEATGFSVSADLTNGDYGSFNRIAYQVSVTAKTNAAPDSSLTSCIHLADYQTGPFQPVLLDTDSTNIQNASSLEFVIDPPAPNGANRLLIFTGDALVGFLPTVDDVITRGTVTIKFVRDIGDPSNLKNATASASLSSIFNADTDHDTTYAVDCAQVTAGILKEVTGLGVVTLNVPELTAAIAVQGGGGTAGISRLTYQANIQIVVPLQILVSSFVLGRPPVFANDAGIGAGQQWLYQIQLPTFGGAQEVQLSISDPATVQFNPPPPATATVVVPGRPQALVSQPQPSTFFSVGQPRPVRITAILAGFTAHATLTVFPPGT
jgi:hypothetical protein